MRGHYLKGMHLETMEIEMRKIPGFAPRHSGLMRGKEDSLRGPDNQEASGEVSVFYEELVEGFLKEVPLSKLSRRIQEFQKGEVMKFKFLDGEHKRRFKEALKDADWPLFIRDNGFDAAIYLLSADSFLWDRAKGFITEKSIEYSKIHIHGVDLDGYALFCAAKEVCGSPVHLTLSELGDRELIKDALFEVLLNGILISRYGLATVLKSKRAEKPPKQKREQKEMEKKKLKKRTPDKENGR